MQSIQTGVSNFTLYAFTTRTRNTISRSHNFKGITQGLLHYLRVEISTPSTTFDHLNSVGIATLKMSFFATTICQYLGLLCKVVRKVSNRSKIRQSDLKNLGRLRSGVSVRSTFSRLFLSPLEKHRKKITNCPNNFSNR